MDNRLLRKINEDFEATKRIHLTDEGTLIGLPNPYTVPSKKDKFQEMYYWDTYFANLGLISLGKVELAKNNTDNLLYLLERFGHVPNGSRLHFLPHSQPPFLSKTVRDVFECLKDKEWLYGAYNTLKKEYEFWQTHRILENKLNAYNPPISDNANIIKNFAVSFLGRVQREPLGEESFAPNYPCFDDLSDFEKSKFANACGSFCESGWDFNSRFLDEGFNFAAVDLNSLLYDMEENMRYFSYILDNGEQNLWESRKQERLIKMQTLWSDKDDLFLDFNVVTKKFSGYKSLASVYPMYAKLATKEQAEKTVRFIEAVELEYGFAAGENKTVWHMQWDYPKVWAPLQVILYESLKNYGYFELAERVATKYVSLVEKQYAETGELWEKYDGITGGHPSSAVPMTGWTAGAYAYFCKNLKTTESCRGTNKK